MTRAATASRDPRHRQEGLDRAAVLVQGPVPQLRECPRCAEAVPEAAARDPHRRQHARYVPGDRRARLSGVRQHAAPDLDRPAPHIKAYYDAYKAAGHPGKGQVFVSAPIYIAETEERARAEAEESVTHFYRLQYELIAESARRSGRQNVYRARREAAHADLCRRAARQRARRHPGQRRSQTDAAAR